MTAAEYRALWEMAEDESEERQVRLDALARLGVGIETALERCGLVTVRPDAGEYRVELRLGSVRREVGTYPDRAAAWQAARTIKVAPGA